jgi:hypothetical protein
VTVKISIFYSFSPFCMQNNKNMFVCTLLWLHANYLLCAFIYKTAWQKAQRCFHNCMSCVHTTKNWMGKNCIYSNHRHLWRAYFRSRRPQTSAMWIVSAQTLWVREHFLPRTGSKGVKHQVTGKAIEWIIGLARELGPNPEEILVILAGTPAWQAGRVCWDQHWQDRYLLIMNIDELPQHYKNPQQISSLWPDTGS